MVVADGTEVIGNALDERSTDDPVVTRRVGSGWNPGKYAENPGWTRGARSKGTIGGVSWVFAGESGHD